MTTTAHSTTDSVLTTRDLGPAPEKAVAKDLVRRGLLVLPIALAIGFVGWGSTASPRWPSPTPWCWSTSSSPPPCSPGPLASPYGLLMGVSLFGFLIRIGLITAAVLLVRDMQLGRARSRWASRSIITHLGLLFWETRYVSASLAFPGLKPASEE